MSTPQIERHLTVVGATVVVAIIDYILNLFGVFDFLNLPQIPNYR